MSEIDAEQMAQATELSESVRPLLAGRDPEVVGVVLAEMVAVLIAGHVVLDREDNVRRSETDEMRLKLMMSHIAAVRQLIPVAEAEMFETRGLMVN